MYLFTETIFKFQGLLGVLSVEREPDMSLPTSVAGIEVSDAIILPPNPVVVQLNSIRKLKERRELEILETVNRMELSQDLSRCFVCAINN